MSESRIKFGSVWAQDTNRVIGSGADMLWRVPADQQFFKDTTMGAPIIYGRGSWEAQRGPLKGRTNIVVTRNVGFDAPGALVVHTVQEAFELARKEARSAGLDHAWVTGGGQIYEQTMDLVDELIVTEIDLTLPSDGPQVLAPPIDLAVWEIDADRSDADWRAKSGDARWKVLTYVRRGAH